MQNAWEAFDAAPVDQMADFGRWNATSAPGAGWAVQSRAMQRTWETFDAVMAIRNVFLFQRHCCKGQQSCLRILLCYLVVSLSFQERAFRVCQQAMGFA
jgi:hypothetical protein